VPVPKVLAIETEYGISVPGMPDANPITTSSLLINAYVQHLAPRFEWDYVDESPGNDARGFSLEPAGGFDLDSHLVNTVLTNGARFYVDHAHPEYSSPECISPIQATLYDKAGEEVLRRAMKAAARLGTRGSSVVVYKNNSDRKGNSYGCHENYLMDRSIPFVDIVRQVVPFFVTRQIFAGAGKVGSELPGRDAHAVAFQLSQRADFFEEEVGLETTLKRPIVNTRDEPHADQRRFRRLHFILGDANLSETSTWLKLGTTAIVLAMIEDGVLGDLDIVLRHSVAALREISWDPTLTRAVALADGRKMRALEIQWEYLRRAREYGASYGFSFLGDPEEGERLLSAWEEILHALESDVTSLANRLDWVAKYQLMKGFCARHGCGLDDPRVAAIDLQYHDIRTEKSLYERAGLARLLDEGDIRAAVTTPPAETRAYFRGTCLSRFPDAVAAANWDSLIFDLGSDPLRRVPMMDPLKGTKAHVGTLLENVKSASELVELLGT